jgi:hypothetical protein
MRTMRMPVGSEFLKHTFAAAAVTTTVALLATTARSQSCVNSCVTVAIPRADGVVTKLDGSADAALWPPSQELRTITISALNERNTPCDVTIDDVLQDETPAMTKGGAPIDDAVGCVNDGVKSTIQLRSDRDQDGNGRSYHVMVSLTDPDCTASAKDDELLISVPQTETSSSLQPDPDVNNLIPSYNGDALACVPEDQADRVATLH